MSILFINSEVNCSSIAKKKLPMTREFDKNYHPKALANDLWSTRAKSESQYLNQWSLISFGKVESRSQFKIHKFCNNILAGTVIGASQYNASYKQEISDKITRFVGGSDIDLKFRLVNQNLSWEETYWMPRNFTDLSESICVDEFC